MDPFSILRNLGALEARRQTTEDRRQTTEDRRQNWNNRNRNRDPVSCLPAPVKIKRDLQRSDPGCGPAGIRLNDLPTPVFSGKSSLFAPFMTRSNKFVCDQCSPDDIVRHSAISPFRIHGRPVPQNPCCVGFRACGCGQVATGRRLFKGAANRFAVVADR